MKRTTLPCLLVLLISIANGSTALGQGSAFLGQAPTRKEVAYAVEKGYTITVKATFDDEKSLELTVRDHRKKDPNSVTVLTPSKPEFQWTNSEPGPVVFMIAARKVGGGERAYHKIFHGNAEGGYVGWSLSQKADSEFDEAVAQIHVDAPEATIESITIVANTKDENKEGKPSRARGIDFWVYEMSADGNGVQIGDFDNAWATKELPENTSDSVIIPIKKVKAGAKLRIHCAVPDDVNWNVEFVVSSVGSDRKPRVCNASPTYKFNSKDHRATYDFELH